MKVFDKVLNKEVEVQEVITPEIGREIFHEDLKPQIEVDVKDIRPDEPKEDVTSTFLKAAGLRCRVLQSNSAQITQTFHYENAYDKHGQYWTYYHGGIDLVKYVSQLDYITAHTGGVVDGIRTDCTGYEGGGSYGNYVLVKHANGYHTRYAHLAYGTIKVKLGQTVKRGDVLAYMNSTGESYSGHLHFEIIDKSWTRLDPEPYLNTDLPGISTKIWVAKNVWMLKNEKGVYLSGWQEVNGKWYHLNTSSKLMTTGWLYDKAYGGWFYLSPIKTNDFKEGEMWTGWAQVKGKWYFLARTTTGGDIKGRMVTGWLKDKNKWYYLDPKDGSMYTGTHTIDGKSYTFNSSGALVTK